MSYEEEVRKLRYSASQLNKELVEKIAELVKAKERLKAIEEADPDNREGSDLHKQVNGLAREHNIDFEGVIRVFKEIARLTPLDREAIS